jgi:hypothetical protein
MFVHLLVLLMVVGHLKERSIKVHMISGVWNMTHLRISIGGIVQ